MKISISFVIFSIFLIHLMFAIVVSYSYLKKSTMSATLSADL